MWRNKGQFFLFSLMIALIAVLVLITAGLGDGLELENKEYLDQPVREPVPVYVGI